MHCLGGRLAQRLLARNLMVHEIAAILHLNAPYDLDGHPDDGAWHYLSGGGGVVLPLGSSPGMAHSHGQ